MNSLVSIAISTYNGEAFLREQLDSILNQTYKNLEIIISDDCSIDNTIKIIREYQDKDKRIVFHQNKKNLGFVKNFENAISLCTGDYIALSDQDDIWKLNKIELFVSQIKENSLIYSNATLIDKNSKEKNKNFIKEDNIRQWKSNIPFLLYNVISGNTMMFKKELLKHILPFPNNITYHDFWIAFVASTYGTITYTQEPMIFYRKHDEQVTFSKKQTHKNYLQKLQYKKEILLEQVKNKIYNLEAFRTLSILDNDTKKLLDLLTLHYNNYEDIYFNTKLYNILKNNADDIFFLYPAKKRKKQAFRHSVGLKLNAMTLYKI
nr:glycosyltransferase family 2 protein [uncultured Sulfurimonas sp.]